MFEGLIPLLSLGTLLCVCIFALINAERTKDRMRDPNAPVSTLARDGRFGGVAFLLPPEARFRPYTEQDGLMPAYAPGQVIRSRI
jgi:hypothetical protein